MKNPLRTFIAALTLVSATGAMAESGHQMVVRFAFDSDVVNEEKYHQDAAELAEIMKAHGWINALVLGYADNTGSKHYNDHLSQRRAQAVVDKLVNAHDLPRKRFDAVGLGISNPVASNDTEEGRAQNRRSTAVVILPAM